VRIISGQWKGRNILAPKNLPVRPTTDFAKTALFNILANHFDFQSISVLDLFCGTGNISYEFASRGTTAITCVDENIRCVKFVESTFEKLKFPTARIIKSDVFSFINHCEETFDIVFADPPFDLKKTDELPGLVLSKNLLTESGWLIVEHQAKRKLESSTQPDEIRVYSNCAFSIYKKIIF
jgi:16S rRNA (guanine966-N2)-methyltransferase